ncbi:CAP domain-containing protein [Streptomyces hypolithicus]
MNREPQPPQHSQDPIPARPARHGRRSGAHRSRTSRRGGVTAAGAVALIAVAGGGYGAVQALSGSETPQARGSAQSVAAPDVLRAGGGPSPSATASDRTTATPSGRATASPAERGATAKATPAKARKAQAEESRTTAPAVAPSPAAAPRQTPAARAGAGSGRFRRAPAASTPAGGTAGGLAQQVVEMVNTERAKQGCSPVTPNAKLRAAAQGHSDDMAARSFYDHSTPEGVGPGKRIAAAGYRWSTYAENIFKSPRDARTAMDGWMKSPGHRANILNCAFKEIGVGINMSSNGPWWTQNFGASS